MSRKIVLLAVMLPGFMVPTIATAQPGATSQLNTTPDDGKASRPHILPVMADDQGYGDCGFTGHPFVKTPNLDAMARQGIVVNHFYAAAPVCSPTRASVLTGRHPFRGDVPNHGHYLLRPNEVTLAEALKTAGYATAHFGKWHIGSVQPSSPTSPGGAGFDEWLSALNFPARGIYSLQPAPRWEEGLLIGRATAGTLFGQGFGDGES